jgi:hypothetical protein
MSDLHTLSLSEASKLIRDRKLSPVEYTRALVEHTERHDGKLNAFLRFTPEIALADAQRAETEIMTGGWRGPLHGVPYGLKDIVDYAGLPTTGHSAILKDSTAATDAFVTRKLRAAGGVFMGKLSTHEFAIGGPCFDLPWPPARNPWNRDHFCGGSSSGSGRRPCHQRQSGKSESRWEKTIFGSAFALSPSSRKVICSEQSCLVPWPVWWQCALIQASAEGAGAPGFEKIKIARQGCFAAMVEMISVSAARALGSSV